MFCDPLRGEELRWKYLKARRFAVSVGSSSLVGPITRGRCCLASNSAAVATAMTLWSSRLACRVWFPEPQILEGYRDWRASFNLGVGRDLGKKGSRKRQVEYAEPTARKAIEQFDA